MQSYFKPLVAAIAEGATTPDPGTTNAVALSTTTGAFMRWTGTEWNALGGGGEGGGEFGTFLTQLTATVDFGDGLVEDTLVSQFVAADTVNENSIIHLAVASSTDHSADEIAAEGVSVYATEVDPGVGFTLVAVAPQGTWGEYTVAIGVMNSFDGGLIFTKADIGLSLVDNTADMSKPVSTAQAAADMLAVTALSTKTAPYTLTATDNVILSNYASAEITLPSAATIGAGRQYTIKNINASTGTLKAVAGTIDGVAASTGVALLQYQSLTVVSDGANWHIL